MRYILNIILMTFTLLVVSCSDAGLRYLGYMRPSWPSNSMWFNNNHMSVEQNFPIGMRAGQDGNPGVTFRNVFPVTYDYMIPFRVTDNSSLTKVHGHYFAINLENGIFCQEGYMSEIDVKDLKKELHLRAYKNLKYMLSLMNKESFDKTMFYYVFVPFLSYGIRDKINTIYNNGDGSGLGGWHMFKPTLGLDEEAKHYNVKYVDNGWYKIWIGDCADTVKVKIKYAGKYLNPIIVGVKNDKMQIAVADDNYDTKTDSKMIGCTPYDDEYMFLEFMCPLLHASVAPGKFVEENDFENYVKKINAMKLQFVQNFYTYLVQTGNNIRKVQKKFHNSLVWYFMNMIDNQKEGDNYDTGMFLPCSYADFTNSDYTITYLGKDWYEVTSSNGDGQNLRLKVVLYGKKLTPAIVGMRNPQKSIDYCPARFEWHEND